ncbi:MAG: hypothetical protein NT154_27490 [Verrucomicrobia bacterium]|nr:hypothetical protein [Verrucomicrobiota bacterium]
MSKVLHDSNSRHPRGAATHVRALPARYPRGIRAVSARPPDVLKTSNPAQSGITIPAGFRRISPDFAMAGVYAPSARDPRSPPRGSLFCIRALPARHPRVTRAVSARYPRGTTAAAAAVTGMVTVGVTGTATGTAAAAIPCCLICKQHGTTAGYSRLTLPPRRGKKTVAQSKRGTSAALGYPGQIVLPLSPSDGERGRGEEPSIKPTTTATVTVTVTTTSISIRSGTNKITIAVTTDVIINGNGNGTVNGGIVATTTTTITKRNGTITCSVHPTKWDKPAEAGQSVLLTPAVNAVIQSTLNSYFSPECGSENEPRRGRKTATQFELASISG